jgi:N-acetylglucosaminyl-diphospho-decaprenol L-rhamnosyltransferase
VQDDSGVGGPVRTPAVGVVIVHWNQPELCLNTLGAFADQSVPVDVVVIDNGSAAEALDELRPHLNGATLCTLGRNAGFGPAANVGFRHWLEDGRHSFLAVAPHDALPEPDCLERIVKVFESHPEVGLASADVGDGATPTVHPYLGSMPVPASVAEGWEPGDYGHGTLLMARRDCLLEVGLFDERYFAYGEEIDLGLRAKKAGWSVGLVRGARVHNPSMGAGPAVVDYLFYRNTLLLVSEHWGAYNAAVRFVLAAIAIPSGMFIPSTRPPLFSARGRLRGLIDFLRGRYGPPPSRYFEQFDRHGEPMAGDAGN